MIAGGVLPNFLIIGAQKCGTTSLHRYLMEHPEIFMSPNKELHFFVTERNWHKGVKWYARQFAQGFHACGEASPSYTAFPRYSGVPERIHHVLPEVKLIYLIRDPIQRLVSHYVHRVAAGREHGSLREALDGTRGSDLIWRSRYAAQLSQFLTTFSADRILVVTQEALLANRLETIRQVFRFPV
ncbi:MAG: sulfotransferase [Planctomycetaceae bacterium]